MLEIRNFRKTYANGKVAVNGLSLTVERGDILGFIGQNGAGKTTTIRACVGVLPFDSGDILIDGHSVRSEPLRCKELTAYIPDDPALYGHMTGTRYLNFVADMYRVPRAERESRIRSLSERLELSGSLNGLISSYSHGMKQKLAIIAALTHEPKLMVLDEPFVGLDPKASHTLREIMGDMCKKGAAVFFSSHVLETVEKLCNKIAIIKNGGLLTSGYTDRVRGDHSLEEVFLELTDK
jgi:ABC-2 type transport system ATP-binding protein